MANLEGDIEAREVAYQTAGVSERLLGCIRLALSEGQFPEDAWEEFIKILPDLVGAMVVLKTEQKGMDQPSIDALPDDRSWIYLHTPMGQIDDQSIDSFGGRK